MAADKDIEIAAKTNVEDIGVHEAVGDDQSRPGEKQSLKNVGALEVFYQNIHTHAPSSSLTFQFGANLTIYRNTSILYQPSILVSSCNVLGKQPQ